MLLYYKPGYKKCTFISSYMKHHFKGIDFMKGYSEFLVSFTIVVTIVVLHQKFSSGLLNILIYVQIQSYPYSILILVRNLIFIWLIIVLIFNSQI